MTSLPPFVLFFVGALLVGFTKGPVRKALVLGIPLVGGVLLWLGAGQGVAANGPQTYLEIELLGYTLTPFRADKLSLLFGYLFHLAAFLGFIYALHVGDATPEGSVAAEVGETDVVGNARAGMQHVAAML